VITTDFTVVNSLYHWCSKPKFDLETCRIRTRGGNRLTVTTVGRMGTAIVTPYSLADTVRLPCYHCQGRHCLILVPPLRESQIFQKCWDVSTTLYSAVPLKTATCMRKTKMHTFLNNLFHLIYPLHVSNK